jgi:hypothetical protein
MLAARQGYLSDPQSFFFFVQMDPARRPLDTVSVASHANHYPEVCIAPSNHLEARISTSDLAEQHFYNRIVSIPNVVVVDVS